MENIKYLDLLLNQGNTKKYKEIDWIADLNAVLKSSDVLEIAGYPQLIRASFILARAKMRQENSKKLKLTTFGLENLINELENIPEDAQLKIYALENNSCIGNCFVFENDLIGCEFVKGGIAKTIRFDGYLNL